MSKKGWAFITCLSLGGLCAVLAVMWMLAYAGVLDMPGAFSAAMAIALVMAALLFAATALVGLGGLLAVLLRAKVASRNPNAFSDGSGVLVTYGVIAVLVGAIPVLIIASDVVFGGVRLDRETLSAALVGGAAFAVPILIVGLVHNNRINRRMSLETKEPREHENDTGSRRKVMPIREFEERLESEQRVSYQVLSVLGASALVGVFLWVNSNPTIVDVPWWAWGLFWLLMYAGIRLPLKEYEGRLRTNSLVGLVAPSRLIPVQVKQEVSVRDMGRCRHCGSRNDLQYDHIVPYSKGGRSDSAKNVQLLCGRCNRRKSNRYVG